MKTLILLVCLACAPALFTSCANVPPPATRVVAVQTLKSVGEAAETTVALSAQLYSDGKITADKARQVADFFDRTFQPAFRVAVAAAKSDLGAVAPSDILSLASQLSALLK